VIAIAPVSRFIRLLAALALASPLLMGLRANAEVNTPACAVADTFPNPKLLEAMRRGVNLPGWDSEDESRRPTVTQLDALRERGFTHIRLLLDEKRLQEDGRETYLDTMFEQVILLFSLDYAVSLDLHAGGLFERGPREAEVLQWNAAGKTAEEIGIILNVSTFTVQSHLRHIREKLGANNVSRAVSKAIVLGEIQAGNDKIWR